MRLRFGIDPPRLALGAEEFAGSFDLQAIDVLVAGKLRLTADTLRSVAGARARRDARDRSGGES